MKKNRVTAVVAVLFVVIAGVCYSCSYRNREEPVIVTELEDQDKDGLLDNSIEYTEVSDDLHKNSAEMKEEPTAEEMIYVHICGAVKKPDVYQVATGTRLVKVVELAGGFLETAAEDYMNQAQKVVDGQRIYIPTKEELEFNHNNPYIGIDSDTEQEETLVNINRADERQLMELPGIGQAKAKSIIEYRKTQGGFRSIEELMKISGIKEGLFQQISSYITVE